MGGMMKKHARLQNAASSGQIHIVGMFRKDQEKAVS
jgi:hypothetical protein